MAIPEGGRACPSRPEARNGRSDGRPSRDAYTGEELDWSLISQYDNDLSKEGRHHYKAGFALLPTVDHLTASASSASFRICAWRTNDAKNDMSTETFVGLCATVLIQAGYRVEPHRPAPAAGGSRSPPLRRPAEFIARV